MKIYKSIQLGQRIIKIFLTLTFFPFHIKKLKINKC